MKGGGIGDCQIYGPAGVCFHTRPEVVITRWPDPATSGLDLGFPPPHPLTLSDARGSAGRACRLR